MELARDNPSWGYLRIAGAIANLGYFVSKSTVRNILKRNGFNPSGKRELRHFRTIKNFVQRLAESFRNQEFSELATSPEVLGKIQIRLDSS